MKLYNFVPDSFQFTQLLRLRRYERKYIENRRFRSNAVTLIQHFRYKGTPTNQFCTAS